MQNENIESICPAQDAKESTPMSSKEFQRTLYTWFEEKGLVSDLRSYLRVLMINELRNTTVGKVDHKTNFSLPKQAFSLVIAEHLLREGCHYTLSIFSTEVPGVATYLPFNIFEAHCRNEKWRFDQDSLLNVLELIGISKGSSECLRIASLYFRNADSLLTCLINSKIANVEMSQLDNPDGDLSNYVYKILTVLGVPPNMMDNIKKKIHESVAQEFPLLKKQIVEMQTILSERNNQIKLLVDDQILQKKENKKLKIELRDTEKRIKKAAIQEQNLNLRETQIREKLDEVTRLQRGLTKSLSKEKTEICLQKHCNESCQNIMSLNGELRNAITRLEEVNREKTLEIERLNSKLSSMAKDLQNSKLNIEFLNSCLLRSSQINLHQGQIGENSSEETSENLTGEVLKQVRSKLHELELESDALDIKFKKLKITDFVTK